MSPQDRQALLEASMDGTALSHEQERANLEQHRMIGEAALLVLDLRRTTLTDYQRGLVDKATGLLRRFADANNRERLTNESERAHWLRIAGRLESPTIDQQACAKELRSALTDLANPVFTSARRAERVRMVRNIVDRCPGAFKDGRVGRTLRSELGQGPTRTLITALVWGAA